MNTLSVPRNTAPTQQMDMPMPKPTVQMPEPKQEPKQFHVLTPEQVKPGEFKIELDNAVKNELILDALTNEPITEESFREGAAFPTSELEAIAEVVGTTIEESVSEEPVMDGEEVAEGDEMGMGAEMGEEGDLDMEDDGMDFAEEEPAEPMPRIGKQKPRPNRLGY